MSPKRCSSPNLQALRMWLCVETGFAEDEVKRRSSGWVLVQYNGVLIRRTYVDTDTHRGEGHLTLASHAHSQGSSRSWETALEQLRASCLQREPGSAHTSILDLECPGCETVSLCCLSQSVCGDSSASSGYGTKAPGPRTSSYAGLQGGLQAMSGKEPKLSCLFL